jgi:regulatory protein
MQGKRQDPNYQAEAILSRREHSVFEVKTKLRRRKFTQEQINEAVARLAARGLLNDERFAQVYVASTLRQKAIGPRWLRAKLVQKGIARPLIDATIAAAFPPGAEEEVARRAVETWRRTHPGSAPDHVRLARFLASRGFSQASYAFLDGGMRGE